MDSLRQKLYDLSIKKKIQIILSIAILLLFFISSTGLLLLTKSYDKTLSDAIYENLFYASIQLDDKLSYAGNLANIILADSVIQEELPRYNSATSMVEKSRYQTDIYNTLTNHLFNSYANYISHISILWENDTISTFIWQSEKIPEDVRQVLIKRGLDAGGTTIWITDFCQEYGLFLVKELREAKHFSFRSLGVLVICIKPEALLHQNSRLKNVAPDSSYLLLENKNVIFTTGMASDIPPDTLNRVMKSWYGTYKLDNETIFAVHGYLKKYGWDYICIVPYNSIMHTISFVRNIFILLAIVSALLIFVAISRILTALFAPLNQLVLKMQTFADGNFSRMEDSQRNCHSMDETGFLHLAFDKMADKIIALVEQNYVNELLNKEAQLKSLESQMSPHFLYNTLDTIHWRAKISGEKDIAKIASSLAALLRMSLSKTKGPFLIRQELILVDNYMAIQLLRHRRRLDCQINIPEELQNCQIPKFTIQPLVENAVQYGLNGISDDICHVTVTAAATDSCIEIEVKNNGSQFETDDTGPQGLGIALSNIDKRLKITYGDEYGITLSNFEDPDSEEIYAIARILIPQIHISS